MVIYKILTIRNKKVLELFHTLKQQNKFISNTDFLNKLLNFFKDFNKNIRESVKNDYK